MTLERVVVGPLETNCYLLKKDGQCLVIDPGEEYDKIKKSIGKWKVVGVLITHAHFDHVGALSFFAKEKVYDFFNLEEGPHQIGNFSFTVIDTPGHKSDSISIYFQPEKWLFTGDFLFRHGIGRTDLPTGSMEDMVKSLEKMKEYPEDIEIYPGHGESSYLGEEICRFSKGGN